MFAELITAALAATTTTLVPRQVQQSTCLATIACPANDGCISTAANGAQFQVKCTTNYNGQVIEINQAASMSECITACSLTAGCEGLNYKGEFCYLLGSSLGASQSATAVQAATKTSPTADSSTCTADITCPGNDGCLYKANNKNFYARCNFDFYGGDMNDGDSKQTSLKDCVDKCSTTSGCVAVSYTAGGTCYMKNVLKPAVYSANVNGVYME